VTSLVFDVNGLSIRMAHSLTEDAHLRAGEAGVSLLSETPVVPAPYSRETDGVPQRHGFSAPSVHGERVRPTGSPGEASFPSPKGGDIPWALLETRHHPRLGAAVAKERHGGS
jgi:hypothetical protein